MTAPLAKPTLTLREALRESTRPRHEALDSALMPPGHGWTHARYRRFLRGTLAVMQDAESAIAATLPAFVETGATMRTERLRRDLRGLDDDDAVVTAVPITADLRNHGAAFGAAYVLEGSMLGGQHVAQAVIHDLALDDSGLTYLRPSGVAIGPRWKAFVAALDAFGSTAPAADWGAAEEAAAATFAAFAQAFRREGLI